MSTSTTAEALALKAQIASLEHHLAYLQRDRPVAERDEMATAHARADAVAKMYGGTASQPIPGESALRYRQRLVAAFAKHSPAFRDVRLDALDASLIAHAESTVYADAAAKAADPESYGPGQLVPVKSFENGREVTRYHGDPLAWMGAFMGGGGVTVQGNRKPAKA